MRLKRIGYYSRMMVLIAMAAVALSLSVDARHRRGHDRFHGRDGRKEARFINGHDARDGRFDGRGPRRRFDRDDFRRRFNRDDFRRRFDRDDDHRGFRHGHRRHR